MMLCFFAYFLNFRFLNILHNYVRILLKLQPKMWYYLFVIVQAIDQPSAQGAFLWIQY